ncbi:MAG: hypothetical protein AB8B91_01180 [Rubripirellula sp.]
MRVLIALQLFSLTLFAFPASGQEADQLAEMRDRFNRVASKFTLTGGEDGQQAFEFLPQPVSNWSNAERRTHAGGMFLWTVHGRPQAVMCVYPNEKVYDHEFQSLSLSPIVAKSKEATVWSPTAAGVEFRPMPAAAEPGASSPLRLRQMRRMARDFSAKLVPPNRTQIPLRLQPSPTYRYESNGNDKSDLISGAMFTFVQGTDPEVLLLIEAVRDSEGKTSWQYALARMTMVPTEVRHREELVFAQTNWAITRNAQLPYYVITAFEADETP